MAREAPPDRRRYSGRHLGQRDRYELRSDARRFETWEVSYALRLGLGRAVDYALDIGVEAIWRRVEGLAASLRRELAEVPSVEVHDLGVVKCSIVTFSVDGWESRGLRSALAGYGVNIDLSEAVDTRLDFEARNLEPMIRASVHYFNTEDEIARFVRLIRSLTGSVPPAEPGDQAMDRMPARTTAWMGRRAQSPADETELALVGGALCLDFVNTVDPRHGRARTEYLTDYTSWSPGPPTPERSMRSRLGRCRWRLAGALRKQHARASRRDRT